MKYQPFRHGFDRVSEIDSIRSMLQVLPFFRLYTVSASFFPRHREEILVHLNSMVERFDVILQKRLVLFGMGFDNKEPSESSIDQLDGNSEEVLRVGADLGASDAQRGRQRTPSKDFGKSESLGPSPGRSPGRALGDSDMPKKLTSRNLTRSNSYETALAEESRLRFTFAQFFSDLDVSDVTAKPLGSLGCWDACGIAGFVFCFADC